MRKSSRFVTAKWLHCLTRNDEARATHWKEEKRDKTSGSISSLGTHIYYGKPVGEGSLKQDVSSLSLSGHVYTRYIIHEKALANTRHYSRVLARFCGWHFLFVSAVAVCFRDFVAGKQESPFTRVSLVVPYTRANSCRKRR